MKDKCLFIAYNEGKGSELLNSISFPFLSSLSPSFLSRFLILPRGFIISLFSKLIRHLFSPIAF